MPGVPPARYGYLGPAGTFTHQALLTLQAGHAEPVPYASVILALDAVRDGEVDAALVPIENSVEGGVSATLDNLASGDPLVITAEVLLPVQFTLFARRGTQLADVAKVLTHPHAAAQCRHWTARSLPHATVTEGGSTAAAAAEVSRPDSPFDAAICADVAGKMYRLEPLATKIADNADAVTRFVLVARVAAPPPPTGADKTTLVAFMKADKAGGLMEILEQFASRGVNLSRLESRPTKTMLGSYCFSIDADGHIADARVAEALMGLKRACKDVVFLGSYPRADKVPPLVEADFTEAAYRDAAAWLESIRNPLR